jgi:hypothetical protein
MIWFYERGDQHLFYEVRLSADGSGYELSLASPDGPLLTERFETEADLSRRFTELQAALVREGWGPMERRPGVSALERGGAGTGKTSLHFC